MFSQELIEKLVKGLVVFSSELLLPLMVITFVAGCFLRALIFFTIKREEWFSKEFEKRVHNFLDNEGKYKGYYSFFVDVKVLLEKTYYELFEMRAIMKRRNPDYITTITDRLFLVQHGVAWLVRDTLKQVKYLRFSDHNQKFLEIVKNIFQKNPCFNKLFGIVPISRFNDFLNILPGLFIIGGIFGTFLGIMAALPELNNMDLTDVEMTKQTMNLFLTNITFSMSTSIIGIILSVGMQLFNTFFSPEKVFLNTIEKFENSLDILWNRSENNRHPNDIPDFDEHRDPIEALAEDALLRELGRTAPGLNNEIAYESFKRASAIKTGDTMGEKETKDPSDSESEIKIEEVS
ncbi:MAG: hypothetical protein KDD61_15805 [Bdellovibrionales bacterium]|nr:hypothetical protein [Bdellovibrionales bacterium]